MAVYQFKHFNPLIVQLLVCAARLNHADAFAVPSPLQQRVPTTTSLSAATNPYLQSLSETRSSTSKAESTKDYLKSLTITTVDVDAETPTSTHYSSTKENKNSPPTATTNPAKEHTRDYLKSLACLSIETKSETHKAPVCFESTTGSRPTSFTLSVTTTATKTFGSGEYLKSLEICDLERKLEERKGAKIVDSTTAHLYNAGKDDAVSTPTTIVAKKSSSQDYLKSLARFDAEIKAETKKAASYLDCTTAALYSAAKAGNVSAQSATGGASGIAVNKETSKKMQSDTANDAMATNVNTMLTEEVEFSISSPSTPSVIATDDVQRLTVEADFFSSGILEEDDTAVLQDNFVTAKDFPGIYTTITEDMLRRVAMAADFVLEKQPLDTLNGVVKELSVGDLTDRLTRGLVNLGEVFVMALGIVVQVASGKDLNDLVKGAQKAAKNAIATSVTSLSVTVKEIGEMEVSEVLQSMIRLVVTISNALFRMLNAVVEIVTGKSVKEIRDAAAQSIEAQTGEILATVDALSEKSLHELASMLAEFELQTAGAVLKTTTATMEYMGANLEVLTGLKKKAAEFEDNTKNTAVQGV
eukprot:scaffold16756_cov148-Amphora_coffeaeformis.AAC.1